MKLWLVIRTFGGDKEVEYMGAFDSRERAEAGCRAFNDAIYGPFVLNELLSEEPCGMPADCYFPLSPDYRHERLRKDGEPIV